MQLRHNCIIVKNIVLSGSGGACDRDPYSVSKLSAGGINSARYIQRIIQTVKSRRRKNFRGRNFFSTSS